MADLKDRRFDFLSLKFNNYTMDETIERLEYYIQTKRPHMIATMSAELIVRARENECLRKIYNNSDLLTIDSFVVYYAAKLFNKPIVEPVHATRLAYRFLEVIHKKGYRVYLLGADIGTVTAAVKNLKFQYPGINIVGWHHGYFDFENDAEVVSGIKRKNPDVLFVGMSSPLKENFISKNLNKMGVPVCIGVGGGIDIMAGICRLSPLWISKMGGEWFYRFIQEPRRMWKRYLVTNTKFLGLLIKDFFKTKRAK